VRVEAGYTVAPWRSSSRRRGPYRCRGSRARKRENRTRPDWGRGGATPRFLIFLFEKRCVSVYSEVRLLKLMCLSLHATAWPKTHLFSVSVRATWYSVQGRSWVFVVGGPDFRGSGDGSPPAGSRGGVPVGVWGRPPRSKI